MLTTRGAMIYFGINGIFSGSDVDRTSVEVGGIDAHRILTDDTNKVVYYSEIWPAPRSKRTDLPLDDVFDGENATEFVTTMRVNIHKVARDTSDGETTNSRVKDASTPQFHSLEIETAEMHGETPHGETPHGEIAHGETASAHVEATEKHEETTHGETMSVSQFHPSDLVGGTTFLMNEQEDIQGQRS
jgi:hypothetical protein